MWQMKRGGNEEGVAPTAHEVYNIVHPVRMDGANTEYVGLKWVEEFDITGHSQIKKPVIGNCLPTCKTAASAMAPCPAPQVTRQQTIRMCLKSFV